MEHPRSRGENDDCWIHAGLLLGTSPLTRGKLLQPLPHLIEVRNIPAHAGKTNGEPWPQITRAEHPRSRGENIKGSISDTSPAGTSPLTRGKRGDVNKNLFQRRNIPAHAGKTSSRRAARRRKREHPRSRGENLSTKLGKFAKSGTSPLTRGKQDWPVLVQPRSRNIPAHAGKTRAASLRVRRGWEHPRSRGENHSIRTGIPIARGTSPLTRGKP